MDEEPARTAGYAIMSQSSTTNRGGFNQFWQYVAAAAIFWTIIIGGSLIWNLHLLDKQMWELARKEAIANFNKDQGFRLWGTKHGGVYVPITEHTPPSPFMVHLPERDIETPSGRKLTLMNPAYMVRQMMDEYTELYGIRGKITGLTVLREGNAPDEWEQRALVKLRDGAKEVSEVAIIEGEAYQRMMRPMYMKPGCDKCHGHLGYETGDFRGGVGIAVPIKPYLANKRDSAEVFTITHAFIWLLGLGGIGFGTRQLRGRMDERDFAETEAKLHRDRLAGILDIAPEAVITIDADMTISLFNQGAERIFGYSAGELIGRPFDILMPKRYRLGHRKLVEHFDNSGKQIMQVGDRGEIYGLRKDGSEFPASASVSKLRVEGERIHTVLLHDITARKRDEEALVAAKEQAELASRAKSEFLANMSHELRTPLNSIIGFSQMLEEQVLGPIGRKRYREYAGNIHHSGDHLLELISDILDISKIEAGETDLDEEAMDVDATIEERVRMMGERAETAGVEVSLDVPNDFPGLFADRRRLKQIVLNLLSNSVKFTPAKGRVTVQARLDGDDAIVIKVRDSGVGIPEEELISVMQPFTQVRKDAHESGQPGTGLGLSLVNSLTKLHGGDVVIESALEEGTTVTVKLPPERTLAN